MTQVIGPPPAATPIEQPTAPTETPAVVAPPEADQQTSFIDPAALNDLESSVVEAFERRQAQSTGPSSAPEPEPEVAGGEQGVTSPATPTPPATTPPEPPAAPAPQVAAPAATPPPEATQSVPPVVDPFAPPEPVAYDPYALPAPPPTQPAPTQVGAPAAVPPGYVDFMGTSMPVAQATQMQQTYQWAQALTPEESHAINQFIEQNRHAQAGAVQPAPIQPPTQPIQYQAPAPTQATAPSAFNQPLGTQPIAAPPAIDFSQIEDPNVAAYLQQQQAWQAQQQQIILQQQNMLAQMAPAINDTQQMAAAAIQQQQQQQNAESNQRLDQARWDFAAKYNLSSAELDIVEQRLTNSNLVPELVNRRGGDIYAGITDGFETVAWTAPDIRARLLQSQVAPAIDDARDIQNRAAKLGALAGQGGAVPTQETAPVTAQDRHRGMVAALEAAMNNQPS